MTTIALNGLKLSQRLREAGFSVEQAEKTAEAIASAVQEVEFDDFVTKHEIDVEALATKEDVLLLKRDISELSLTMKKDSAELKVDIQKYTFNAIMSAVSINIIAIIGALFVLAKLLGH